MIMQLLIIMHLKIVLCEYPVIFVLEVTVPVIYKTVFSVHCINRVVGENLNKSIANVGYICIFIEGMTIYASFLL